MSEDLRELFSEPAPGSLLALARIQAAERDAAKEAARKAAAEKAEAEAQAAKRVAGKLAHLNFIATTLACSVHPLNIDWNFVTNWMRNQKDSSTARDSYEDHIKKYEYKDGKPSNTFSMDFTPVKAEQILTFMCPVLKIYNNSWIIWTWVFEAYGERMTDFTTDTANCKKLYNDIIDKYSFKTYTKRRMVLGPRMAGKQQKRESGGMKKVKKFRAARKLKLEMAIADAMNYEIGTGKKIVDKATHVPKIPQVLEVEGLLRFLKDKGEEQIEAAKEQGLSVAEYKQKTMEAFFRFPSGEVSVKKEKVNVASDAGTKRKREEMEGAKGQEMSKKQALSKEQDESIKGPMQEAENLVHRPKRMPRFPKPRFPKEDSKGKQRRRSPTFRGYRWNSFDGFLPLSSDEESLELR